VLLFAVTGFLGLPLLWMSRAFTRQEKIVYSIAVAMYSCGLIALTIWGVLQTYSAISQLLSG
jgi:hypothetical protein